jgi:hypothetical protein
VKQAIPDAILKQHIAILGKTGSGKTSTAKLCIEQVVASGARVCILDPIKSDWWGLTSSASGKREGLPFRILGGPRGHVPLHSSAGKVLGELVGKGKLRLSIFDMADFEPGGLQKFFVDFAASLFKHARGVVYLVMEEAHEFAPKEKSGIGNETMAIYWAKRLATGSRKKGVRLIMPTQRAQALHNALLGSCDTLVTHRLTLPADQEAAEIWLKKNVTKELFQEITSSFAKLPTGSAWVCSGEAQIFERVQFPRIKTYDNSATPENDDAVDEVKTAAIDHDELKAIIGDAVREAEANDPKALKAEIARLKSDLAKAPKTAKNIPQNIPDPKAEQAGYDRGWSDCDGTYRARIATAQAKLQQNLLDALTINPTKGKFKPEYKSGLQPSSGEQPEAAGAHPHCGKPLATGRGDGTYSGPQMKVLRALAMWKTLGHEQPTKEMVGAVAGYSPRSGGYATLLSSLRTIDAIDYPSPGLLVMKTNGIEAPSREQARDHMLSVLSNPQRKIVDALIAVGSSATKEKVGEDTGYSPSSGGFATLLSSIRTLGIIDYPQPGHVALSDWAQELLS